MKALGDHMHSLGVSFGIYSDEGTRTCGGFQGSEGHEATDAKTFASWVRQPDGAAGRGRALPISSHAAFDGQGVDYLKLDGCYNNKAGYIPGCENPHTPPSSLMLTPCCMPKIRRWGRGCRRAGVTSSTHAAGRRTSVGTRAPSPGPR